MFDWIKTLDDKMARIPNATVVFVCGMIVISLIGEVVVLAVGLGLAYSGHILYGAVIVIVSLLMMRISSRLLREYIKRKKKTSSFY